MWHHLENHTIALGFSDEQTQNNRGVLFHILKANLATRPLLLNKPKVVQWTSRVFVGC